jgi:hypothetical protein
MGIARHPEVEGFEAYFELSYSEILGQLQGTLDRKDGRIDLNQSRGRADFFGDSLGSRQYTNITRYSKTAAD